MSKHNEIGIKGEYIASEYLLSKGYIILYRNWRSGHKEVDLVAWKNDVVALVEIKTRTNTRISYPEEAVNRAKQMHLRAAALVFMEQHPQYRDYRFDIVSIVLEGGLVKELLHFEGAF